MAIYSSLLVALIGLVIYLVSEKPKLPEIGRIMFWTGLLAFLLHMPEVLKRLGV